MISFYAFLEQMQIRAIAQALRPGSDYIWREKCREYSIKFSTPLHEVLELDPEFVIQNLYEIEFSRLNVKENLEEVLGMLHRMNDPGYQEIDQEELEDLVDLVLAKEIKRKGEVRSDKKKAPITAVPEAGAVALPTQGGIRFDQLANSDESEFGQGGFKE